jgi:hypothetical protein
MVYCFDIDGTICTNTDGDYSAAQPDHSTIDRINALYECGHTVYFHTARGSTTRIDWRKMTEQQLRMWGVRYHVLFMGKPTADLYVDDKAISAADWKRQADDDDT